MMGVCRKKEACCLRWYFDLWAVRNKHFKTRRDMVRKLLIHREIEQKRGALLAWRNFSEDLL